jgi:hypothetical protein
LREIFRDFGLSHARCIGCIGWKYFDEHLLPGGPQTLDVPAYLVDLLRELAGDPKHVVNAVGIFMDVCDGLRVFNEPAQIAQFEYAAGVCSKGVLSLLRGWQKCRPVEIIRTGAADALTRRHRPPADYKSDREYGLPLNSTLLGTQHYITAKPHDRFDTTRSNASRISKS